MWIVIDEASRFLSNALRMRSDLGPPILQDQAQSMRKRRLYLVVGTQSVSELPTGALVNFSTKVVFKTGDGVNLRYLGDILSLSAEQKPYVASLPERRALLSFPFWPRSFVIEVPLLEWPRVSPETVQQVMEPILADLKWVPLEADAAPAPASPKAAVGIQPQRVSSGSMLTHAETEYLITVARDPFLAATERDRKNRTALGTGAAMRKRLVEGGYLSIHKVKPPGRGGEITLTEVTGKGWTELRLRKVSVSRPGGRGGFLHTFWQAAVREWVASRWPEATVRIEGTVNGKAIDVLASIEGQLEAFEVVMNGGEWASQLKEVSNIVKDIEVAGITKVSICAEDEQTLTRIKEHLLRECGVDFIGKHQGKVQWRLLSEFLK